DRKALPLPHEQVRHACVKSWPQCQADRFVSSSSFWQGDREDITKCNHYHERRRANKGGIAAGLVLGEHLDRAEGNLILPGGRTAATSLGEPFPAIRCREGGWRRRIFGHHWNHSWRLPGHASMAIVGKHLLHPGKVVGSN